MKQHELIPSELIGPPLTAEEEREMEQWLREDRREQEFNAAMDRFNRRACWSVNDYE